MLDKPKLVDIYLDDDTNMQKIVDRIFAERVSDLVTIRSMVDAYEWSSEDAKDHVKARLEDLFNMGVLDVSQPRPKGYTVELIDL